MFAGVLFPNANNWPRRPASTTEVRLRHASFGLSSISRDGQSIQFVQCGELAARWHCCSLLGVGVSSNTQVLRT